MKTQCSISTRRCLPIKCAVSVLTNGRQGDDYERRSRDGRVSSFATGRETSRRAERSRVDGEASRVENTMHYAQHVRQHACPSHRAESRISFRPVAAATTIAPLYIRFDPPSMRPAGLPSIFVSLEPSCTATLL